MKTIPPKLLAYINNLIRQKRRLLSLEFDVRTSATNDEIKQYISRAFTTGSISMKEHDEMLEFLVEEDMEKMEIVEEVSEKINVVEEFENEIEKEVAEVIPKIPREPYFLIDISTLKRKERILEDLIEKRREVIKRFAYEQKYAEEKLRSKVAEETVQVVPEPEIENFLLEEVELEKIEEIEEIKKTEKIPEIILPSNEEVTEVPFENSIIYIIKTKNDDLPSTLRVLLGEKEIASGPIGPKEPKIKLHSRLKAGFLFEPTAEERAFRAVYKKVDEMRRNQ